MSDCRSSRVSRFLVSGVSRVSRVVVVLSSQGLLSVGRGLGGEWDMARALRSLAFCLSLWLARLRTSQLPSGGAMGPGGGVGGAGGVRASSLGPSLAVERPPSSSFCSIFSGPLLPLCGEGRAKRRCRRASRAQRRSGRASRSWGEGSGPSNRPLSFSRPCRKFSRAWARLLTAAVVPVSSRRDEGPKNRSTTSSCLTAVLCSGRAASSWASRLPLVQGSSSGPTASGPRDAMASLCPIESILRCRAMRPR
mmetsp:Transcript_11083/g.16678  ORF Transcript_11083/g.16678 Transcript_11083/m.16678 type:complete len:251 (+) Transcript_11083:1753-2505(+)